MAFRRPTTPRPGTWLAALALAAALPRVAHADYALQAWLAAAAGAAPVAAGAYSLDFALGQPLAGPVSIGPYTLNAGFWAAASPGVLAAPPLGEGAPKRLELYPPAPNPSASVTAIRYDLPAAAPVRLDVLDVDGRRVRALESGGRGAGRHVVIWNGSDDAGRPLASGLYMVRLDAGETRLARRIVHLR